jgi:hypothetical protein
MSQTKPTNKVKQLRLLTGVAFALMFAVLIASATGLPSFALFGGIVALSFLAKKPGYALFSAIDTTELAAALGDYYRENRDIMITRMLLDPSLTDKFNVYDNVTDELPMPNLEIANLIKPGHIKTFAPTTDSLAFGARILKVRDIKADLLLVPTDLHKQWLGFAATNRRADGSRDPWDMPFEAFIMDYISKNVRNQLYLQAIFKGDYNAVGTTPGSTMDGFATLVTDLIAAGDIAPVDTANISDSNVISVVEAVYDGLDEAYKAVPTQMFAEPAIFNWYLRKYRTDFGANNDYEGMRIGRVNIDGSLCDLVREPALAGTGRVICAPQQNFAYGCDTVSSATMDIQKFDRGLKVLIDFKAGVQFQELGGALSVNKLSTDVIPGGE